MNEASIFSSMQGTGGDGGGLVVNETGSSSSAIGSQVTPAAASAGAVLAQAAAAATEQASPDSASTAPSFGFSSQHRIVLQQNVGQGVVMNTASRQNSNVSNGSTSSGSSAGVVYVDIDTLQMRSLVYDFEQLFDDLEWRSCFRDYLRSGACDDASPELAPTPVAPPEGASESASHDEHTSSSHHASSKSTSHRAAHMLEFYEGIDQYRNLVSSIVRFEHGLQLAQNFVRPGGAKSLPLLGPQRRMLVTAFDPELQKLIIDESKRIGKKYCPRDLFDAVQNLIFVDLKHRLFERFIDDHAFEQFMKRRARTHAEWFRRVARLKRNRRAMVLPPTVVVPPPMPTVAGSDSGSAWPRQQVLIMPQSPLQERADDGILTATAAAVDETEADSDENVASPPFDGESPGHHGIASDEPIPPPLELGSPDSPFDGKSPQSDVELITARPGPTGSIMQSLQRAKLGSSSNRDRAQIAQVHLRRGQHRPQPQVQPPTAPFAITSVQMVDDDSSHRLSLSTASDTTSVSSSAPSSRRSSKSDASDVSAALADSQHLEIPDERSMKKAFNEADFSALLSETNDSTMWKSVVQTPQRQFYVSQRNFSTGHGRWMHKYKEVMVLPYSIEEVLNCLFDQAYMTQVESKLESIENVDLVRVVKRKGKVSRSRYTISICRKRYAMRYPLQKRDFCVGYSIRYDEEFDRYLVLIRSMEHPDCLPGATSAAGGTYVRGVLVGGYVIEALQDQACRLSVNMLVDLRGYVLPYLWNNVIRERDDTYFRALQSALLERRAKGLKRPQNNCKIIDTLDHQLESIQKKKGRSSRHALRAQAAQQAAANQGQGAQANSGRKSSSSGSSTSMKAAPR